MLTRLLLFAALTTGMLAPLYAQDEDVTRYIEELRAPKPPRDWRADQQAALVMLKQQLDNPGDAAQKASLYLRISDVEQSLGEPDAAIAAARNAVDLLPADPKVAVGLAAVLVQNGQTAEVPALLGIDPSDGAALLSGALRTYNQSLAAYLARLAHRLLPGDPKAADTLGQIYMRLGNATDAGDAFRDAATLAPQVALYHYHMGVASLQSGRHDQAQAELNLALESNPTETERADIQNTLARLDAPFKKH